MATIVTVSFGITDFAGKRKTAPFLFPSGSSDAQIQTFIDNAAIDLDAVIDGKLADVFVTRQFNLPAVGLKGSAINGNMVREGALLSFDVASTPYGYSVYVPSWSNTGFSGNTVLNTGARSVFIADLVDGAALGTTIQAADRYANDIVSYLGGKRTFRK